MKQSLVLSGMLVGAFFNTLHASNVMCKIPKKMTRFMVVHKNHEGDFIKTIYNLKGSKAKEIASKVLEFPPSNPAHTYLPLCLGGGFNLVAPTPKRITLTYDWQQLEQSLARLGLSGIQEEQEIENTLTPNPLPVHHLSQAQTFNFEDESPFEPIN